MNKRIKIPRISMCGILQKPVVFYNWREMLHLVRRVLAQQAGKI